MSKIRLMVHGGAWNIPDSLWGDHQRGCQAAWQAGIAVLADGGEASEAVCAAIRVLEDDPVFDAGRGSVLNEHGKVELEAGLMEGHSLRSGAVLGVDRVRNPIDLAHLVLKQTNHCIFTAEGAHALAEQMGMPLVDPQTHVIGRERDLFERVHAGDREPLATNWVGHDTVGAIALDHNGNLAAGNSTGGTLYKKAGRVGDAAVIGSGFYADNHLGAVICTGWGESIMRSGMAMLGLFALEKMDAQAAAEAAIQHLAQRVDGLGGILLLTPDGNHGVAYNTQRLAYHL